MYKDSISGIVDKALKSGELGLVISFGHKDGGKSYTVIGNSNHQLQKNITDPIELSDDSRGLLLRCLHQIKQKDPSASITLSAIDVAMDSIRDLLKYVKKEHSKSTQEINSGPMKSTSLQ